MPFLASSLYTFGWEGGFLYKFCPNNNSPTVALFFWDFAEKQPWETSPTGCFAFSGVFYLQQRNHKIDEQNRSQNNAVITKRFEVVFLDEIHEEFDGE